MRDVLLRWRLLSATAVLAVLAAAVLVGLTRTSIAAVSAVERHQQVVAPPPAAEPAYAEPAPGPLLAPSGARRAVASRGDLAYDAVGAALTGADVPAHSLAAYQRATAAIGLADRRCHLGWELLAAIGKVASDHGRTGGAVSDDEGVSRPRLLGPRLTGRQGTSRVADSDAGDLDRDRRVDRALGPMMLLPATWAVVSVDGDSDGRRNPQDVDDAALAASVFLCAGPGDLRNRDRLVTQVRRYHSGDAYLRTVLSVRRAYRQAAALAVPTTVLARDTALDVLPSPTASPSPTSGATFVAPGSQTFLPGPGSTPGPSPTPSPSADPAPSSSPSPSTSAGPSDDPTPTPSDDPTPTPTPTQSDDPSPTPSPTESAAYRGR